MYEWQYKVTTEADVFKKQTEHKYNSSAWNKVYLIENIFSHQIALIPSCYNHAILHSNLSLYKLN
ncbi:hypothetical protein C6H66_18730 [Photorhabdus hindustanensis]|uniref:Uncharacterized protein n=1 Tax=Photorhabdus hindustanensis TaxID=2918802 RepID=A0A2S8PX77_9GAMM|nr:hypothetical protein C6H66_18730 [Photorhabdus hindustanensis]